MCIRDRDKAPKVSFFGNQVNIPQMTLGVAEQPTYLRDIPLPGDKIQFVEISKSQYKSSINRLDKPKLIEL